MKKVYYILFLIRSIALFAFVAYAVRVAGKNSFGQITILFSSSIFLSVYGGMVYAEHAVKWLGDSSVKNESNLIPGIKNLVFGELKLCGRILPIIIIVVLWLTYHLNTTALWGGIAIALCFSTVGYQSAFQILLLRGKYKQISYLLALESLIIFGCMPLMYWQGATGYGLSLLMKNIIGLCAIFWLSFSIFRRTDHTVAPPSPELKLKHQHSSLVIKSVWANLDMLVMGLVCAPALIGEFRVVKSLSNIAPAIAAPVWNIYKLPILKAAIEMNWLELRRTILRVALYVGLTSCLICAIILNHSEWIVENIYKFEASSNFYIVLSVYMFAIVFLSVCTAWSRYLAVIRNELSMSLKCNILLTVALLFSPIIYIHYELPIPIIMSIASIIVTLLFWLWLFRITSEEEMSNETNNTKLCYKLFNPILGIVDRITYGYFYSYPLGKNANKKKRIQNSLGAKQKK